MFSRVRLAKDSHLASDGCEKRVKFGSEFAGRENEEEEEEDEEEEESVHFDVSALGQILQGMGSRRVIGNHAVRLGGTQDAKYRQLKPFPAPWIRPAVGWCACATA